MTSVQWGNIPEWLAGVGTVCAFGVTYLLLRSQVAAQRLVEAKREEEVNHRLREQARLISASLASSLPPTPRDDDRLVVPVEVRNRSDEPIYNVILEMRSSWDRDAQPIYYTLTAVAPDSTRNLSFQALVRMNVEEPPLAIAFTDTAGLHWLRQPLGQLERLAEPFTFPGNESYRMH
jgi:hypothetical protein